MLPPMSKNRHKDSSGTTHFGYRRVADDEKASLVRDVFDSVASKYDLMNDLRSLGVHRLWKGAMMDWLAPKPSMRLVDVGGGTGDIAFRFRDRGGGPVSVVDINREMLRHGRDRAIDKGITDVPSSVVSMATCPCVRSKINIMSMKEFMCSPAMPLIFRRIPLDSRYAGRQCQGPRCVEGRNFDGTRPTAD